MGLPLAAAPSLPSGLRVLIACGPYTTTDNLSYEPFTDLLAVLQRDAPDVCILVSGFLIKGKLNWFIGIVLLNMGIVQYTGILIIGYILLFLNIHF